VLPALEVIRVRAWEVIDVGALEVVDVGMLEVIQVGGNNQAKIFYIYRLVEKRAHAV
jgi:uncharacterized protein YfkK (UPF0435 family)